MAEVTVKQLADSVGAPVERLLRQMQEAGLAHQKENEAVSEDEKQVLLSFLKRSHGEVDLAHRAQISKQQHPDKGADKTTCQKNQAHAHIHIAAFQLADHAGHG